jgi:hypothetical protein
VCKKRHKVSLPLQKSCLLFKNMVGILGFFLAFIVTKYVHKFNFQKQSVASFPFFTNKTKKPAQTKPSNTKTKKHKFVTPKPVFCLNKY